MEDDNKESDDEEEIDGEQHARPPWTGASIRRLRAVVFVASALSLYAWIVYYLWLILRCTSADVAWFAAATSGVGMAIPAWGVAKAREPDDPVGHVRRMVRLSEMITFVHIHNSIKPISLLWVIPFAGASLGFNLMAATIQVALTFVIGYGLCWVVKRELPRRLLEPKGVLEKPLLV